MSVEVDLDKVLEPKHKAELRRTFALMKEFGDRAGVNIYVRLFQDYPDYRKIFPKFRFLTDGEILNSRELQHHGDVVLMEFDRMMNSLDDPAAFSTLIKRMARQHKYHKVTKRHMMHILPEILGAMEFELGELTPLAEESWSESLSRTKLISYIAELVTTIDLRKEDVFKPAAAQPVN